MKKIIALGDSFTQGYIVNDRSYTRQLIKAGFSLTNLGKNGSMTDDMLARYKSYLQSRKTKEDILIVFGASNDFIEGRSIEFVRKNIESILTISDAEVKILISPPYIEEDASYCIYKRINEKIESYEKIIHKAYSGDILIIDAKKISGDYIDGVHMNQIFHENLASEIIRKIKT